MKSSPAMRAVVLVACAAALWGTTGTAQTFAHATLAAAWTGALRLLVAAVFFAIWLGWRERGALTSAAVAALPWTRIALAAAAMTAYNLAFFAGVRATGVATGTAIALGSGPIWAGIAQALVRRTPLPGSWWTGTLLAVAGGVLMIAGRNAAAHWDARGIALCLLAGLAYAGYALVNKTLVADSSVSAVTGAVFSLAALLALPIDWALAGPPTLRPVDLAIVAWLGVMSTGVAYLLFSHALRNISGATGVALALAEPVVAFLLAIVVVGERPGWIAVAGLGGVLAGLAVVIRSELRGRG